MPQRGEIYYVMVQYKESHKVRPCVVLLVKGNEVDVALISAQKDLYDPDDHFWLKGTDQEEKALGLAHESYVIGHPIVTFQAGSLKTLKGSITGDLANAFYAWIQYP